MTPTNTSSEQSSRARYSTRQGAEIEQVMSRLQGFNTAQDVHAVLRADGSRVGLATVYRHLADMAERGDVDALRTPRGEVVYRRCGVESHHHHLICRSCGKTLEFEGPEVETWAERIALKAGFLDVSHTVEVFGTCSECASKPSRRPSRRRASA
jgi:Fur family ferric uptake transcriptional regulator